MSVHNECGVRGAAGASRELRGPAVKLRSCWLHLRCIARKLRSGEPVRWHVDHLLREFGLGCYAEHS